MVCSVGPLDKHIRPEETPVPEEVFCTLLGSPRCRGTGRVLFYKPVLVVRCSWICGIQKYMD